MAQKSCHSRSQEAVEPNAFQAEEEEDVCMYNTRLTFKLKKIDAVTV